MTPLRPLTDDVLVSGQITVADVDRAAAEGVVCIINNRPDQEEVGQPSSDELEAAARAAGIIYVHAPAAGLPGPDTVEAVGRTLARGGRTLMFCRSGMRSTAAWGMAMARSGALEPEAIRDIAARAGYDISRLPL